MAFGFLKKWWEEVTPQNEEALRRSQASIANANQKVAALGNNARGVLGNPQVRQQWMGEQANNPGFSIPKATIGAFPNALRETGTGIGLGTVRLATSRAQEASGIYDLATPGLGTSRLSKGLDNFAKQVDQTAKGEGVNGIYRGAQIIGEPITYAVGGAGLKALGAIPKVAKATNFISKPARPVAGVIDKTVNTLNKGGMGSKLAATAVKASTTPSNVANMALNTGLGLGYEAGRGRDVSKADVALNVGLSGGLGVGMPVVARALTPAANKLSHTAPTVVKNLSIDSTVDRALSKSNLEYRAVQESARLKAAQMNQLNREGKNVPAYLKKGYDADLDEMMRLRKNIREGGFIGKGDDTPSQIPEPNNTASNKDLIGKPSNANKDSIDISLPEIVPPKAKETPLAKSNRLHEQKLKKNNLTQNEYAGLHNKVDELNRKASALHRKVAEATDEAVAKANGQPLTPKVRKELRAMAGEWGRALDDHVEAINVVRKIDGQKPIDIPRGEAANKPKGVILSGSKKDPTLPQTANVMIKEPGKAMRVEQRQINTKGSTPEEIGRALGMSDEDIARAGKPDVTKTLTPEEINDLHNTRTKEEIDQGVLQKESDPTSTFDNVYNKYLDIDDSIDPTVSKRSEGMLGGIRTTRDKAGNLNVLRHGEGLVGKGLKKIGESDSRLGNKSRRLAQYLFNKQAGLDPAMVEQAHKLAGGKTFADFRAVEMAKNIYDLAPDAKSLKRIHSVIAPDTLESIPVEQADGTYKQVFENAPKFKDLTPNEQKAANMLREYGDAINDTSYRNGDINKKQWEHNKGGKYMARLYKTIQESPDVSKELGPDFGIFTGLYKSRKAMNDDMRSKLLRDPVKIASIRARQVQHNAAMKEYMQSAEAKGYVSDSPKNGYVKVEDGATWYNWSGRYVDQAVYEQAQGFKAIGKAMNVANDALDLWDGLAPRRWRKKLLTVFNPVVRLGNRTSNYFFAYLNGINPVTFADNMMNAKKALKNDDPIVIAMTKAGMLKNNTVVGDKNLFDVNKAFTADLDRVSPTGLGRAKNADKKITESYGGKDDQAKVAAVMTHMERGYSLNQAMAKTRRGFQDYSRVGHMYDLFAKSPAFGNAFARFQGDLYMNIIKNAAVDHPVRLASLPLGILALGETLSNLSGESNEDKKTREDRAGAAAIPFSKPLNQAVNKLSHGKYGSDRNVSLDFQTPFGAVDVARFTPLYLRQDIDGNSALDDASRVLPFNIPSTTKGKDIAKKAFSDPLVGPLGSLLADVDWMGKSVKDPDGYRDGKALFPDDPLSKAEEWRNRLQYGVRSYAPYPMNELGDILSYSKGNPRNEQAQPGGKNWPDNTGKSFWQREGFNTQGSKKNVLQGVARLGGVRIQQFNKDEAQAQREKDQMFDYFDKVDNWKNTLDSTTKSDFEARHKSTRTRSGINAEFTDDPFWKYKSASELLQNPKLFDAEKSYAQMQNQYDGKPIDPIFDLSEDHWKQVLLKKLKMPGAKDEGLNTLYDQDWYQDFRQKQDKYYKDKDTYLAGKADDAEKSGNKKLAESFRKSLNDKDNEYPEASAEVQKGIDYYFNLPKGTGERSSFIRNNPGVWKQITDQWDKQDAWNDKEREKLGLPAIPDDDDKYTYGKKGYSRGGGGRKGSSKNDIASLKIRSAGSTPTIRIANKQAPKGKLLKVSQAKPGKRQPIKIAKAKKIKDVRVKKYA